MKTQRQKNFLEDHFVCFNTYWEALILKEDEKLFNCFIEKLQELKLQFRKMQNESYFIIRVK